MSLFAKGDKATMPVSIMEDEKCTAPGVRCRVCGHDDFRFVGYQWLPVTTILRLGGTPSFIDPEKPDMGAVELFVCMWCGNSLIKL